MNSKQPMQPIVKTENGTIRFRANEIVRWLLDNGGKDMNDIAMQNFTNEDREQFAMLIGYSLSGAGDLSYMSDETYNAAEKVLESGISADQARIIALEDMLESAREGIRKATTSVFRIHEDDLHI